MKIKIKKLHPNAVIPKKAHLSDAGMDLTVTSKEIVDSEHIKYGFGISIEIPLGCVGLIFPRSSIYKQRQVMSNSVGVIDSGYRGEISTVMIGTFAEGYQIGERAAQLIIMPYPEYEFIEADSLNESDRGKKGYGSSGLK